jgi:hypothetical protein
MTVKNDCDLFGCNRAKLTDGTNVTASIKGVPVTFVPCAYHYEMLEVMDPSLYSLGYTYTNDIELRLHPAVPQTPTE